VFFWWCRYGNFKFSADGSQQRVYATYLGGNGNEQPHSMITDAAGNLIIAGRSNSSNYPILTTIADTVTIVITKCRRKLINRFSENRIRK
jgi:hypothetical protein